MKKTSQKEKINRRLWRKREDIEIRRTSLAATLQICWERKIFRFRGEPREKKVLCRADSRIWSTESSKIRCLATQCPSRFTVIFTCVCFWSSFLLPLRAVLSVLYLRSISCFKSVLVDLLIWLSSVQCQVSWGVVDWLLNYAAV